MKKCLLSIFLVSLTILTYCQWTQQTSNTTKDLISMHFLNDSTGFIVGNDGVFLKTNDRGTNWESMIIDPNDDLTSVCAINRDTLFAGGENLYISTDGGGTWNVIPFEHNVREIKFFSANIGYISTEREITCDHGLVFDKLSYHKTVDGGYSWQDYDELPNNFDNCEIDIISSDTGYLIGNQSNFLYHCEIIPFSSMFKTTDGGNSWQQLPSPMGYLYSASFINGEEGYVSSATYNFDYRFFRMTGGGEEFIFVNTCNDYYWKLEFDSYYEGYYIGGKTIMRTISCGTSWEADYTGPQYIRDIAITDNHEAYAIGYSGLILHKKIDPMILVPLLLSDKNRLDYPTTNIGERYDLSFKLSSFGLDEVVLDIVAPPNFLVRTEGSGEYVSQISGLIIPPMHDTTIIVGFSPSAFTSYLDTVRISSNALNLPQILIPVTGKGIFLVPEVISNDTAFCADSVFLRNELTILPGASMTICPGTIVVIPSQTSPTADINVEGSLRAIGTMEDSICFVADTKNNKWDGISISGDRSADSVFLDYCVIADTYRNENTGIDNGGGIAITGSKYVSVCNSTIKRCRSNDNGGGIYCSNSDALIKNCVIASCMSLYGGGIYIEGNPAPSIVGCGIKDCSAIYGNGGGICSFASSPLILNNNIINNEAYYAGGAISLSEKASSNTTRVIQNFIYGNYAESGSGGIFIDRQDADLMLNTITHNISMSVGGVYILQPDTVNISGNIIYANTQSQLYTTDLAKTHVDYSAIEGGFVGTGIISDNPMFYYTKETYPIQLINVDYSLMPESPCIDAGIPDTTGLDLPSFDLAGNPRIYGSRIDMGAYENHFDYQTIDTGFCPGKEIRLEVDPAHEGANIAIWRFNGQIIYGASENYLVLSNPDENDEGYYDCTLEFPDFTLYSRKIHLYNKGPAPVIKSQPQGANLNWGEYHILELDALTPDYCTSYQWYRNDSLLINGKNSSYIIPYFRSTDAGTYKCWIQNSCGDGLFSQDAVLRLNTTGINESDNSGINIYPNPASRHLTVDYGENSLMENNSPKYSFEIRDLLGRKWIESYQASSLPLIIDVSSLAPGVHILCITNEEGDTYRWKFLKLQE
jgi:hypothetical protein